MAGKGATHQEIGKIQDKHLKDDEDLQEGIQGLGKELAMAGGGGGELAVAGLAGVGSSDARQECTAVQAMETALELAQDPQHRTC